MSFRASTESVSLFALPFLLLAVLPLAGSWWLADHALTRGHEAAIQRTVDQGQLEVCRVLTAAIPATHVAERLIALKNRIFQARPKPEVLNTLLPALEERYGFTFETYLFDGAGNPFLVLDANPAHRPTMFSLWNSLINRPPFAGDYLDHLATLQAMFGNEFTPAFYKRNRGKGVSFAPQLKIEGGNALIRGVAPGQNQARSGLFFWDADPFTRFGGVMFMIWAMPPQSTLLRALLPHSRLAGSSLIFLHRSNKQIIAEGKPLSEEARKTVLSDFTLGERSWTIIDGRLWTVQGIGEYLLYVDLPFDTTTFERHRRNLGIGAAFLLLAGGVLFFVLVSRARQGEYPIRHALFGMLLFAGFTLLAAGAVWARMFHATSVSRAERSVREKAEEIVNRFANTQVVIQDARRNAESLFRSLVTNLGACRDREEFDRLLESARDRRLFTELHLFDGGGQPIALPFEQPRQGNARNEADRFWLTLANEVLRERARSSTLALPENLHSPAILTTPEHPGAKAGPDRNKDGIASFPVFQIDRVRDLQELARRPGRLSLLAVQGADQLFWAPLDLPWMKGGIVFFRNRLDSTMEAYFQRVFSRRESLDSHAFRFLFCSNDLAVRYPLEMPFPRHFSLFPQMSLIMTKISARPLFCTSSWNGQGCYLLAASSIVYGNTTLFVMYPRTPVDEFRDREGSRLFLAFLLAIPLLGAVCFGLARVLEVPIGNLGILQNMRKRLSGFDLAGISHGSKEDVGAAFDSIIENLDEINTARAIQEQLFPLEVLSRGSWQAFGVSKPARDLGGDYFDYHVVNGEKILVVIGDVSGHGIPAALVVSMAKAVVTDFARAGGTNPGELLQRLDQTLLESVKKKRFMTLGLLWIDIASGQAEYYNCGHPYPMLLRANGETSYLKGTGNFLGREQRAPRLPVALELNPGDRFLFYTDGLAESLDALENVDAYDLFLNYAASVSKGLPIRETCRTLLEKHPHNATGKPQPDDFTLVLVERLGQTPA